jgi:hypothetical protein
MIGPLHCFLNMVTDIAKFHRDTFVNRFYKLWVGVDMHEKPRVRQVVCVLEVLFAGWTEVRDEAIAALDAVAESGGQRFDIAAFLYFFEEHLPLCLLSYSVFLRENVDNTAAAPPAAAPPDPPPPGQGRAPQGPVPPASAPGDVEAKVWVTCLKRLAVLVFVRQRKNYTGCLLAHLDKLAYWKRTNHPLYHLVYKHAAWLDEQWGETGLHSIMRCCDFHRDSAVARDEALGIFARRNGRWILSLIRVLHNHKGEGKLIFLFFWGAAAGLDPMTLAIQSSYQRPASTRVKRLTEHNLAEGTGVAIGFLHSIVGQLVLAGTPGGPAVPARSPKGVSTSFTYDLWTCEALTGSPTKQMKGHEIGAPGYALNPMDQAAGMNRDGSDPENAPREPVNGCQQPGCDRGAARGKWRHTCGHCICDNCILRDRHCHLCRGTLRDAMQWKGGWCRDFANEKVSSMPFLFDCFRSVPQRISSYCFVVVCVADRCSGQLESTRRRRLLDRTWFPSPRTAVAAVAAAAAAAAAVVAAEVGGMPISQLFCRTQAHVIYRTSMGM